MRKTRWLIVSPLLVVVALMGYFAVDANSNQGEFVNISHTGAHAKLFEEYRDVYIGHTYQWTGDGLPTIEDVQIIKDDGTTLTDNDEDIQMDVYIDPTNETDLYYGFSPKMREAVGAYEQPTNYSMTKPQVTVVFKVTIHKPNYQFDLNNLQIQYNVNGEQERQNVPLKSFVFYHE
ncbi:hypothetical protein ABID56_002333 [Alkalibacillus flavidus]|uniref:Uncharacterized protein n=1 Tax=Alkalibacillus flavidus TaxID=546021 RepID=A0ABV2KXA8_9BACI